MLWILGIYIWIENLWVFFNVCTIELLLTFTSALLYHFQPYVLWSVASSWGLASVALTKKDAQCLCLAIPCLSQLWVASYSFLDFLLAMELNRLVTAYLYRNSFYIIYTYYRKLCASINICTQFAKNRMVKFYLYFLYFWRTLVWLAIFVRVYVPYWFFSKNRWFSFWGSSQRHFPKLHFWGAFSKTVLKLMAYKALYVPLHLPLFKEALY